MTDQKVSSLAEKTVPADTDEFYLAGSGNSQKIQAQNLRAYTGTYYGITAAETSASVSIVDFSYAPGHIYRYGTNTTPGTTDMLATMNAAISIGIPLYFPEENLAVSGEVDFTNAKFVHFDNTTISPTMSTGNVISISTTAGNFVEGYKYTGLVTVDWGTADWTLDRTSFYISNVYDSEFHFASRRSTVGLRLYGNQRGVVYNDFYLNKFADNNIGVWLGTADATGWCNANRFHGGYFLGSTTVSGSLYEANASHIYIENTPYQPNGNTFYSPSLEFVGTGFRLARMAGLRNTLQIGYAEINSGDTTWVVDTGTKNTIDVFSTAYIDGYDSTLAGSANRLDVSGATEPYVLGPQSYVDFDGKGVEERRSNHPTEPVYRAYNAGGGPVVSARANANATPAIVIRNPGDTQNNVSIPAADWWTVFNNVSQVHWRLSAAPTTGTWTQGDKAFNDTPSVADNRILLGWVGTSSGTPGTWNPMYVRTDLADISEVVTATNVITAAETGKTFYLNAAGGFTSTLPAPAIGLRYTFIVSTAPTTAYVVTTDAGANVLYGNYLDVVGELTYFSAQDTLNFVASTSVIGDRLEVVSDGTNWYCKAFSGADGGITVSVT